MQSLGGNTQEGTGVATITLGRARWKSRGEILQLLNLLDKELFLVIELLIILVIMEFL